MNKSDLDKMIENSFIGFSDNVDFFQRDRIDTAKLAYESGAYFVSNILLPEIEKLDNIKIFYHDLIHEWDESCEDDCDSYAHNELCRNVDLGNAKRSMKLEIEKLKAENQRFKEALENCLINSPVNAFERGDMIRQALSQQKKESEL